MAGVDETAAWAWDLLRWPVLLCLVALLVVVVFHTGPTGARRRSHSLPRRRPRRRPLAPRLRRLLHLRHDPRRLQQALRLPLRKRGVPRLAVAVEPGAAERGTVRGGTVQGQGGGGGGTGSGTGVGVRRCRRFRTGSWSRRHGVPFRSWFSPPHPGGTTSLRAPAPPHPITPLRQGIRGNPGVQQMGDQCSRHVVPEAVAAEHPVVAVGDECHARPGRAFVPCPAYAVRRFRRGGDVIAFSVQRDDMAPRRLHDRLPRRPPRGEGDDTTHLGMTRGAQSGPASHGVAEQHRRYGAGELGQGVQRAQGVLGRVGTVAVPAADAVADPGHQHVGGRESGGHRTLDGVHAQRGQLPRPRGAFTRRLTPCRTRTAARGCDTRRRTLNAGC